jgi:hypothetical protein
MGLLNFRMPTAGGKVWWYTLESKNGFKLQQNKNTGHYRILDPADYRIDWGFNESEMRTAFHQLTSWR